MCYFYPPCDRLDISGSEIARNFRCKGNNLNSKRRNSFQTDDIVQ